MLNSVWANNSAMPDFPPLDRDIRTDVLVIGGGMAGLLCTYRLTQAGVPCALIEADRICHGVTRNTTAKLTAQHGLIYHKLLRRFGPERTRTYWETQDAALRQFAALARTMDCDFEEKDSYIYSLESPTVLEPELEALDQLRILADFVDTPALPFPTAGAVRIANQAQFDPLKFAAGIAADLPIYEHTAAKAFMGNTVITDRASIQARKIIVATHFPILNKHGSYFLKLYQNRSYVLALENGPDVDGIYLDAKDGGLSLRNHQNLLLLGGGGHRTGRKSTAWTPLEQAAQTYFPKASLAAYWATQDCMSLDGLPYIGRYSPNTPDLYVAAGFNKWGMTGSMAAADILCDLVRGIEHPAQQLFSPARSMLRPQLLANAGEALLSLVTPTAPRCPHMGCALKWNRQERSWDCPCHGSRFSQTGALLDNPATGPLKRRK